MVISFSRTAEHGQAAVAKDKEELRADTKGRKRLPYCASLKSHFKETPGIVNDSIS